MRAKSKRRGRLGEPESVRNRMMKAKLCPTPEATVLQTHTLAV